MEIYGKYQTAAIVPNQEERSRNDTKKGVRVEKQKDPQRRPIFAACRLCGAEICVGQQYYDMEGGKICPDCLQEFAQVYFLSYLRTCMPPEHHL